jgi:hypothetical protein
MRKAMACLLGCALGCGPGRTIDSGETGGASTGAGTAGTSSSAGASASATSSPDTTAGGCGAECFDDCQCWREGEDRIGDFAQPLVCPAQMLCPRVTLECARPVLFYPCDGEYLYDEAALQCALEALRDGKPGVLEIDSEDLTAYFEGTYQTTFTIRILDAGHAILGSWGGQHDIPSADVPTARTLPPGHFEGCLEQPDPGPRYRCLFQGLVESDALPRCE